MFLSFLRFLNCSPFPTQLLAEKTLLTPEGMLKTRWWEARPEVFIREEKAG